MHVNSEQEARASKEASKVERCFNVLITGTIARLKAFRKATLPEYTTCRDAPPHRSKKRSGGRLWRSISYDIH